MKMKSIDSHLHEIFIFRPGSASAKQHIEGRKEKSSSVKTQQLGNPVKTHKFHEV